jgi:hypothetical protein
VICKTPGLSQFQAEGSTGEVKVRIAPEAGHRPILPRHSPDLRRHRNRSLGHGHLCARRPWVYCLLPAPRFLGETAKSAPGKASSVS